MTNTDHIAMAVVVTFGLGYMFFRLAFPRKPNDEPGPHNNWRRGNRGREESSFHESDAGMMNGGDGGVSH